MIGQLTGIVAHKDDDHIILMTQGVGYKIFMGSQALHDITTEDALMLWTHHVVREQALDLYGFLDKQTHDFFLLLLSVGGIGPKGALTILTTAPPEILRGAIASGDTAYLSNIPGLGKKTAAKIVVELKNKITKSLEEGDHPHHSGNQDVLAALISLGYSSQEAHSAMQSLNPDTKDINAKIKEALKILAKG